MSDLNQQTIQPDVAPPQPDHTPDTPAPAETNPPMTDAERARVVLLRGLRQPTDAEKAELADLNMREAVIAGHVAPEASTPTVLDAHNGLLVRAFDAIAAGFAYIADTTASGALGPLPGIVRELRGHTDNLRDPEAAAKREQEWQASVEKSRQAAADRAAARTAAAADDPNSPEAVRLANQRRLDDIARQQAAPVEPAPVA